VILWDTHCHLADARFDQDRDAVLARAAAAGLEAVVVVAAEPEAWDAAARLARTPPGGGVQAGPRLVFAYGLHPHEARRGGPETWAALQRHLAEAGRACVALGEIGLDHHYDFSPPAAQRAALERQLRLADDLDLPVILHERAAAAELLDVLRGTGLPRKGGIWHCFSGGPDLAGRALELGLYLGFGGLVTFARGTEAVREAARLCPPERLLLETDAPYLAPVPCRGRRNEPAWVVHVCRFLAELRGEDPEALARATSANARRLLGPGGAAP
jgi:TatD DNase family protein